MKRSTICKIAVGALAAIALTIGAIANSTNKNVDIFFRNIKIMIDGAEYIAKDANGNVVEPFIMDGTTYLPVRAVATAFDKNVKWDGKNATVYIGKEDRMEPDNRLDNVQYTAYRESSGNSNFQRINGTITDYNGNTYTNGLVTYIYDYGGNVQIDYPLNCQYKALTGKIVLPKNISTTTLSQSKCKTSETTVTIVDENGDKLFSANGITASMPFTFDIDVAGVSMITVKVQTQDRECYVALTDLALYE